MSEESSVEIWNTGAEVLCNNLARLHESIKVALCMSPKNT